MNGPIRPGDVVRFPVTSDTTITAIATNVLRRNGTPDGTVTVTYSGSGKVWFGSYTVPIGYAAGDRVELVIDVTAGSTYSVAAHPALVLTQWGPTALPNAGAGGSGGLPVNGNQVPNAAAGTLGGLPTGDGSGKVTLADNVAHGGGNATLALKSVFVFNPTGAALSLIGGTDAGLSVSSTSDDAARFVAGGDGNGLALAGFGAGHGLRIEAFGNGNAILLNVADATAHLIQAVSSGTGRGFNGKFSHEALQQFVLEDTGQANAAAGSVAELAGAAVTVAGYSTGQDPGTLVLGTPVPGSFAAGTAGYVLNAIKAKTDQIGSAKVTVAAPVDPSDGNRLTLYQGDDHTSGDRLPTWTAVDGGGPTLAATGKLRLLPIATYQRKGDRTEAVLEVDATIAAAGSTLTITAPVTADQTAALASTPTAKTDTHRYQLVGKRADTGKDVTIAFGPVTVLHRIPPQA